MVFGESESASQMMRGDVSPVASLKPRLGCVVGMVSRKPALGRDRTVSAPRGVASPAPCVKFSRNAVSGRHGSPGLEVDDLVCLGMIGGLNWGMCRRRVGRVDSGAPSLPLTGMVRNRASSAARSFLRASSAMDVPPTHADGERLLPVETGWARGVPCGVARSRRPVGVPAPLISSSSC